MKHSSMPTKFSGFAWGLAIFCMPVLLWPLALLISTGFSKNPILTEEQSHLFSTFFWLYPFILAIVARIVYKLHAKHPNLAVRLLVLSTISFYVILVYICLTSAVSFF
ncbi:MULTISPECIES: DUF5389 family protein [Pasteurellaceae]|uniref:Uncharacterized protein n=1 Tax=Rodentibacter genomosp. 1 TaxID=1908264 RepID=A0A1V3J5P5_9PAST|nr:DUF5389 family protein [Rodentibacter genomosp. 1]MBF0752515.1 DUF5389 family protein [Pasteurella sp. 19428wF3_WM03]OOF50357.1 hypothetical protein BKK54_06830 [Rodentibacter genomosp. 1]TFU49841.1 hypothetical protein E4T92_10335 [Pasteurella sp. WM03]